MNCIQDRPCTDGHQLPFHLLEIFRTFMDKMNLAEKSVQENGYYSEEEVEEELDKI